MSDTLYEKMKHPYLSAGTRVCKLTCSASDIAYGRHAIHLSDEIDPKSPKALNVIYKACLNRGDDEVARLISFLEDEQCIHIHGVDTSKYTRLYDYSIPMRDVFCTRDICKLFILGENTTAEFIDESEIKEEDQSDEYVVYLKGV